MPDRDKMPADYDPETLRKENSKEELERISRLLRGYFQEDIQALKTSLQADLKKEIGEALKSVEMRNLVRDEVAKVAGGEFKQQVASSQAAVVKAVEAVGEIWKKELGGEIYKNFKRFQVKELPHVEHPEIDSSGSVQPSPGPDIDPSVVPASSTAAPLIDWKPDRKRIRIVDAIIATALVIVVFGVASLLLTRPPAASPRSKSRPYTPPVQGSPAPSALQEISKDPITANAWIPWMQQAEAQLAPESPVIHSINEHTWSDQFFCWFKEDKQDGLYDLHLQENPEPEQFKVDLKDSFDACVEEDYALDMNHLSIFGAQVTVHELLSRRAASGWQDWCLDTAVAPPLELKEFKADGFGGGKTFNLLNGFLACAGLSSRLQIDGNSTAHEYLFTLYAALKELQREP